MPSMMMLSLILLPPISTFFCWSLLSDGLFLEHSLDHVHQNLLCLWLLSAWSSPNLPHHCSWSTFPRLLLTTSTSCNMWRDGCWKLPPSFIHLTSAVSAFNCFQLCLTWFICADFQWNICCLIPSPGLHFPMISLLVLLCSWTDHHWRKPKQLAEIWSYKFILSFSSTQTDA